MRVLLSWLKEFVDIKDVEPEKIADRLNFAGISVEDFKKLTPSFKGVITAKILNVKPHPNADKLRLAYVDYGKGTIEVVCGADNIKPGQIVPYAPVGSSLKNGELVLEARKIRGVLSPGMLCSEAELDLGDDASGILILSDEFGERIPIGIDVANFLKLDEDWLFEFELPSNRPDLYSVVGIAREISAIFNLPFSVKDPYVEESEIPVSNFVKVIVEDEDLCPRYSAKAVFNIQNRRSPFFIRHRLSYAGIRTISAVVDISNYVMLETGQPLHTFDGRLIEEGTIVVRRGKPGETIVTLDGVERSLNEGMLLIADPKKPIAIAGIMGSENSEVSFDTSNVIIESAHFNPKNIMRTSRLLGLITEASSRFEKRVDPEGTVFAARKAAQLIKSICGGEIAKGEVDVYTKRESRKTVKVRHSRIESIIGKSFSESDIKRIFTGLGFSFTEKEGVYEVEVPSFRADLEREIDFIEEVARVDGYDAVPDVLPRNNTVGRYSDELNLSRKIRERAIRMGFSEAITNPLIPESFINLFFLNGTEFGSVRKVVNPLSLDMSVLTPLLSINLLQVVRNNYVRFNKSLRVFEVGKVFRDGGGVLPEEKYVFAATVAGYSIEKRWWSSPVKNDVFDLKGLVEAVFVGLDLEYKPSDLPFFEKGKQSEILAGGVKVGYIGEFKAEILKQLDIDIPVFAVELELEPIVRMISVERKFRAIPLYPPISYDLSFIVPSLVRYGEIKSAIERMNLRYLESVEIFDLYKGKGVEKGKKSMSIRIVFRAQDRTLVEEEVRGCFDEIIKMLKRDFSAEIRGAV